METWTVNLLGVPTAFRGGRAARPRTRDTWGVLVSLLVPSSFDVQAGRSPEAPIVWARERLALRFWANTNFPRNNLRMALHSLRQQFDADCFLIDRDTVRVAPGRFCTDIGQIHDAYLKALAATDLDVRLQILSAVESGIQGQFMEVCSTGTAQDAAWVPPYRKEAHGLIVRVLLEFVRALKQADNLESALRVARRIVPYHWDEMEALKQVEELERATGRKSAVHALRAVTKFVEAVSRSGALEHQRLTLISSEEGRLENVLHLLQEDTPSAETSSASASRTDRKRALERDRLLRLSVFPASFSAVLAKEICDVPQTQLRAFCAQELLQRQDEEFTLTDAIRSWAWGQLPAAIKHRLRADLARYCVDRMTGDTPPENVLPAPFISLEQSWPLLQTTLHWVLEQPPDYLYVHFINRLRYAGVRDLAILGLPYLQQIYTDPDLLTEWRVGAALYAAYILRDAGKYADAGPLLEMMLPLTPAVSFTSHEKVYRLHWLTTFHATLMMNYSDLGEWDKGKEHGQEALKLCREEAQEKGGNHCLRILAEIHYRTGDLHEALASCEEVLMLRRSKPVSDDDSPDARYDGIADARYWHAQILLGLGRLDEAADSVEEALSLWQEKGDIKVGLCLRFMARLHAAQKRFAEARQHARHALVCHEHAGIEVHRIGSLEAIGDVLAAAGNTNEAKLHYENCLRYYETQPANYHARRVSQKLASLEHSTTRPDPY